MSRFLRNIGIMIIASISLSSCNEYIRMETMTITGEQTYKLYGKSGLSLYEIQYKTVNVNNGLTIYVVAESDLFEVGDKVKLIKSEE